MNKVISFSLWGDNPKYTIGAIYNAKLALDIYPEWKCYFFVDQIVPTTILEQLSQIDNTVIIHKNTIGDWASMFWRFETSYNPHVDISIFRDTDSRLNLREKYAVDEWLNSDKTFHIMRDHPFHRFPILGGMWGFKNNQKYNMKILLDSFVATDKYGTDYDFLGRVLYPIIEKDKLVHDDFFEGQPFPAKRVGSEFVGDVFDASNNRHPEFYKFIPVL